MWVGVGGGGGRGGHIRGGGGGGAETGNRASDREGDCPDWGLSGREPDWTAVCLDWGLSVDCSSVRPDWTGDCPELSGLSWTEPEADEQNTMTKLEQIQLHYTSTTE